MGLFDDTRFVERLTFFDGQRLFADDLQNVIDFQTEMRRLHNRFLHRSGVGGGLPVAGARDEREVEIGPGYAIDAEGAEMVLTRARREPVPPVEGDEDGKAAFYDLTISHASSEDLSPSETRSGVCLPRGAVRLREEPVFCWVRLERDAEGVFHPRDGRLDQQIQRGMKIVLARVEVKSCRIQNLSVAERRNARPPTQPYIACGRSTPRWQVRVERFESTERESVFIDASIDTGGAGFLNTPSYSARLDGPRILTGIDPADPFFADGLVAIDEPREDGFLLRVLVLTLDGTLRQNLDQVDETQWPDIFSGWNVVWMGVE